MTATSLYRLGAWSAIFGGVLMAIDVIAHFFVDDTLAPATLGGLSHEAWHIPGIATVRGGVLPAVGGWLFVAAAVFAAANQAFSEAQLISRLLFALAFIWLGFAVLRRA